MKKKIEKLIELLEELQEKAEISSNKIIENGELIPEEHKAKSKGFADAYGFCVNRLKEIIK